MATPTLAQTVDDVPPQDALPLPSEDQTLEDIPPQQDIIPLPPEEPLPEEPPAPPADPEEVLPDPFGTPQEPVIPGEILETTFFVTDIHIDNRTLFDDETLRQIVQEAVEEQTRQDAPGISDSQEAADDEVRMDEVTMDDFVPSWDPQRLTVSQLLGAAQAISEFYAEAGYPASGALVRIPPATRETGIGPVVFDLQEGQVEAIEVVNVVFSRDAEATEPFTVVPANNQSLNSGYISSRLGIREGEPLNVPVLQEKLQLLQLDPLIEQIRASVSESPTPGNSLVTVIFEEAESFDLSLGLNNSRPPSVATDQRQVFLTEANLLGIGDAISVGYSNTDGSDVVSVSYELPLGSEGTSLGFSYSASQNEIIDSDFFDINNDGRGPDIESEAETYEISLRHPIVRTVQEQTFQEFTVSLTGSVRDSRSFLFDEGFPLSDGATEDGKIRIAALRFGQEYTLRDASQVLALRSRFSFGLNAFDSTINNPVPGVEALPDSRFFTWLGQAQWVRVLAPETLLVVRGNLQFADRRLPSAEKFGIGGFGSVRGYRQDLLLTDNGLLASAEVRLPILRIPEWDSTVQLIPFADFGAGWNSGPRIDPPNPNTLASAGVGLQWQTSDNFTARLDWGIPLIDAGSTGDTWQENGLTFSVLYTPF
ncbi:MAG: ShlB/FhaC/HecB family hemolysin secretion/activation protein [Leptolyngbyaceae cyanobacterium]